MQGRSGRIIALSSLGGQICFPGYGALGVAKAGIETLARYLAVELADQNINVNVVCPGIVETEALAAFTGVVSDLESFKQTLLSKTPCQRIGTPEDVARVVLYLCSSDSEWIRGQTIVCDGGLSLV
jgi:NAD(P)-dependent dehydrogenase (short-subunit alcohol dehydrogenase family)